MKINELRLGNIIRHKYLDDRHYLPEDHVHQDYLWKIVMLRFEDNDFVENKYSYWSKIDEACPVELTEDIMTRFGFIKKYIYPKNDIHPEGWFVYEKDGFSITSDYTWNKIGSPIEIKYAHKLQNFYYLFKGEELELIGF